MLVLRMVYNNGKVYDFSYESHSLKEVRDLRDEITLSTHGALTARIDLVEVEE